MSVQITIIETVSDNRVIIGCAHCRGSGVKPTYRETPCPVCNGRGVILLEVLGELPLVACAFCKGTGIKPTYRETPCPQCAGSGAQPIAGKARIIG